MKLGAALIALSVVQGARDDADEGAVVNFPAVALVQREGDSQGAGQALEILNLGPSKTGCV